MNGTVRALFIARGKEKHENVPSASVIETGFEGDYHSRSAGRRQILLMSSSILSDLQLDPGAVFENAVIDGFDVMGLAGGQQLRLGTATVEVSVPCEPCGRMERVRTGLKHAIQNRRGMFVKVVTPGLVNVGDAVSIIPPVRT
jgi:MOSC domain-containing protein YiiM